MCLPAIAIAASIAGTAISAMGAIQQANATASAERYNEQVARNNAQTAEANQHDAMRRAQGEIDKVRLKQGQLAGKQTVAMAANGVDLASGSPLDILGDTAMMGEMDALTAKNNSDREARNFEVQKNNFLDEANLHSMKASSARSAGTLAAVGTALTGLGSVSGEWYKAFGKAGAA